MSWTRGRLQSGPDCGPVNVARGSVRAGRGPLTRRGKTLFISSLPPTCQFLLSALCVLRQICAMAQSIRKLARSAHWHSASTSNCFRRSAL